ncbi:MAG: replication initiator protein [Arizlama microvirus]|nr:MAG: replication initiator protein [Arizlama microvirus]
MACFSPLTAYRLSSGEVSFKERGDIVKQLSLPCGSCEGCKLERSRQWAVRIMHESKLHSQNCFITLTYDDEHVNGFGDLVYKDFQLFMKRLRKHFTGTKIRFYMGGEYGSLRDRPHFHACLFGIDFNDRQPHARTGAEIVIDSSEVLSSLWGKGFASVGNLTFQSAAYVARYVMKKVTGSKSEVRSAYQLINLSTGEVYDRTPEFNKMSLKPGIGRGFFDKFASDIYPHDHVIVDGVPTKPPRYYDKIYSKIDPISFEAIQYERELRARANFKDNTPERLAVRAQCVSARLQKLRRVL